MAIHFNKKTVVVILVIMAMIFFNRRSYFYCIDNAYYEYSVDNKLEYYYGDYKFGHLGKKSKRIQGRRPLPIRVHSFNV